MRFGMFGFPLEHHRQSSMFPYKSECFSVKHEIPGTYIAIIPAGFRWAVIFLSGAGGGAGCGDGGTGSEGGGGGAGAGHGKKIRVREGYKIVMTVPSGGTGAVFTAGPNAGGNVGGTTTCAVYNEHGQLVITLTVPGGSGGATGNPGAGGLGGTAPSETISTICDCDYLTLFSQIGLVGDVGAAFGNDVGGYGGETHLKKFDPFERRPRGIGGPSNNTSGQPGIAPGSGGGGGVGSGNGAAGANGIAWIILIPDDEA